MYLELKAPNNIISEELLLKDSIPCYCRIGENINLEFKDVFSENCVGVISEPDWNLINEKISPFVGGPYYFVGHCQVSLTQEKSSLFKINQMKVFCTVTGWQNLYD